MRAYHTFIDAEHMKQNGALLINAALCLMQAANAYQEASVPTITRDERRRLIERANNREAEARNLMGEQHDLR